MTPYILILICNLVFWPHKVLKKGAMWVKTRLYLMFAENSLELIIEKGIWIYPESSEELSFYICLCSRIIFLMFSQQRNLHAVIQKVV